MAGGSQKNALKHAPPTPKYVLCAFICRDLNSAPNSSFVKTLRGQRNGVCVCVYDRMNFFSKKPKGHIWKRAIREKLKTKECTFLIISF